MIPTTPMTRRVATFGSSMTALLVAASAALGAAEKAAPLPFAPLAAKTAAPRAHSREAREIELGKQLFFDPRLSLAGNLSCNSCHNLMGGGDDNSSFSTGHKGQLGGRSAPTVWNSAKLSVLFWDGRAAPLEEQAKGPLINPVEMAMDSHDIVLSRLRRIPGYVSSEGERCFILLPLASRCSASAPKEVRHQR